MNEKIKDSGISKRISQNHFQNGCNSNKIFGRLREFVSIGSIRNRRSANEIFSTVVIKTASNNPYKTWPSPRSPSMKPSQSVWSQRVGKEC